MACILCVRVHTRAEKELDHPRVALLDPIHERFGRERETRLTNSHARSLGTEGELPEQPSPQHEGDESRDGERSRQSSNTLLPAGSPNVPYQLGYILIEMSVANLHGVQLCKLRDLGGKVVRARHLGALEQDRNDAELPLERR